MFQKYISDYKDKGMMHVPSTINSEPTVAASANLLFGKLFPLGEESLYRDLTIINTKKTESWNAAV